MHAPFIFFSIQAYLLVAIAVIFYLEFAWGCAPPPLSGGTCHTLAAVGSLLLSKHIGGGAPLLPSLASLFIYSSCEGVPLPHSQELRVPHPLCLFFSAAYYSVWFFLFFPWVGISLSRELC
jgi:hypothetical protein